MDESSRVSKKQKRRVSRLTRRWIQSFLVKKGTDTTMSCPLDREPAESPSASTVANLATVRAPV